MSIRPVLSPQSGHSWAWLPGWSAHRCHCHTHRRLRANQQSQRPKVPPTCLSNGFMDLLDTLGPQSSHSPSPSCLRPSPGASDVRTPTGDKDNGVQLELRPGHWQGKPHTPHSRHEPLRPEQHPQRSWPLTSLGPGKVGPRGAVRVRDTSRSLSGIRCCAPARSKMRATEREGNPGTRGLKSSSVYSGTSQATCLTSASLKLSITHHGEFELLHHRNWPALPIRTPGLWLELRLETLCASTPSGP